MEKLVRTKFQSEMLIIETNYLLLFTHVIDIMRDSLTALKNDDKAFAQVTYDSDLAINKLETEINELVLMFIAKHSPVASDLRQILSILKASNDLERIADYASNIAKYVISASGTPSVYVQDALMLGDHILHMLQEILEASQTNKVDLAQKVAASDSELDMKYRSVIKDIVSDKSLLTEADQKSTIELIILLKQLERAGDHLTNIAELIIYNVTGHKVELN